MQQKYPLFVSTHNAYYEQSGRCLWRVQVKVLTVDLSSNLVCVHAQFWLKHFILSPLYFNQSLFFIYMPNLQNTNGGRYLIKNIQRFRLVDDENDRILLK